MKLFFIILIILIFIPIPLKLSLYYDTANYYVKFYNFIIFSNKNRISKRNIKKIKKSTTPKTRHFISLNLKRIEYKHLLQTLYHSKFKPYLKFNFNLEYSLSDCAKTAISYGMLSNFKTLIFITLSIPFKINKLKLNINPQFTDKTFFKIDSLSIIYISLANIIFMLILILKNIHKIKEVSPNN